MSDLTYLARMFDNYGRRYEYRVQTCMGYEVAASLAFKLFMKNDGDGEMYGEDDEKLVAVCLEESNFVLEDTQWIRVTTVYEVSHECEIIEDDELDDEVTNPHKWICS